jgi:hypothetical protein
MMKELNPPGSAWAGVACPAGAAGQGQHGGLRIAERIGRELPKDLETVVQAEFFVASHHRDLFA